VHFPDPHPAPALSKLDFDASYFDLVDIILDIFLHLIDRADVFLNNMSIEALSNWALGLKRCWRETPG
jgi:hypothetical protein